MSLLTCDFETYYDREYSLSKLTVEEYIRDDRFEVIGVSVKVDNEAPVWFSGTHEETKSFLSQYDWNDAAVLCHNTLFDGAILSWRFDIHPKILLDTLSMSRPLHGGTVGGSLAKLAAHYELGEKGTEVLNALGKRRLAFSAVDLAAYGRYCTNDVELTHKLFHRMVEGFPKRELKLIDLTLKMFTEPVLELDQLRLEQHLTAVVNRKNAVLTRLGGDPEVIKKKLMSNVQFAKMLEDLGVSLPYKTSPVTKKLTYAFAKTDVGMKKLLEHPAPIVQALVAARLGVKTTLEETRTARFIAIANRGRLPVPLSYFAAHTGRWGGTDKINFQNLPSRGEDAGKLKSAIRAPEGYVVIDVDSSQIEARVLAWLAGEIDLLDAFRKNDEEKQQGVPEQEQKWDVYKIMASHIYDTNVGQITRSERFVGKATILGCGYGMGVDKFYLMMKSWGVSLSHNACRHIIDTYRNTYPRIPKLWGVGDNCLKALVDGRGCTYGEPGVVKVGFGVIHTPMELPFHYHNLRRGNENNNAAYIYDSRNGVTGIWGGKFTENIDQHLSRVIISQQMLRIAKRYRVAMTVHDAVGCVVRREDADEARAYIERCMRWIPPWATDLPLNCESGMGDTYGDC